MQKLLLSDVEISWLTKTSLLQASIERNNVREDD